VNAQGLKNGSVGRNFCDGQKRVQREELSTGAALKERFEILLTAQSLAGG
jgi:hypothetical protein